jgi:hypothetical protein
MLPKVSARRSSEPWNLSTAVIARKAVKERCRGDRVLWWIESYLEKKWSRGRKRGWARLGGKEPDVPDRERAWAALPPHHRPRPAPAYRSIHSPANYRTPSFRPPICSQSSDTRSTGLPELVAHSSPPHPELALTVPCCACSTLPLHPDIDPARASTMGDFKLSATLRGHEDDVSFSLMLHCPGTALGLDGTWS